MNVAVPAHALDAAAQRASRYRWTIVALLFFATTINYVDRQMIGVLKPTLSAELGWTETDFANIVFWFQVAYAIGYVTFGRVVDRVGVRVGYAAAVVIWTVAHVAHGFASTVTSFALARFGLGVGESGNFPAGVRAVADWFPQKERALAIGIFNAGTNVGAILTPLLVPAIVLAFGWRAAFFLTGILGIVWLVAWWFMYRAPAAHPRVNAAELAWIQHDPPDPVVPIPWTVLIRRRETWAFAAGKFLTDPIWWFFLFWLPGYLFEKYGLDLKTFGLPLAAIYLLSDVGSVGGGWLSSRLMLAGRSPNFARKVTLLICALAVLPIYFAQEISTVWGAVLLLGLATAAHQAFSANLFSLPSDLFPRSAVATVVGIGGAVGAVGGMLMAKFTGYVLESTGGNYQVIFAICSCAYLVAVLAIHLLAPHYRRADLG